MKHFVVFVILIFSVLGLTIFQKQRQTELQTNKPAVRIFGSTSFISQWGPGPWLKDLFEKTCQCRVEYYDSADTTILFQKLKAETRTGVDLVLGFDQYDLDLAQSQFSWNDIHLDRKNFVSQASSLTPQSAQFMPYDWSQIAFVARKSEVSELPKSFADFLKPEWKDQLSIEDPRTSSVGLQFLLWLVRSMGEDDAFNYLKKLSPQVKAYSTSWSMAYGLFTKNQAKSALSYITSPLYHLIEEKNSDVVALEFAEGHPLQVEFAAIPSSCKSCDLGQDFLSLMISSAGQKILMEKNYMFPVLEGVRAVSPFANVPPFRPLENQIVPANSERERLLKRWAQSRKIDE